MIQKKILKQIVILYLAFSLLSSFSVFANDTEQHKEDIFTFVIENDTAIITNVDDVKSVVTVPETLGNVPVTALAGGAFGGSIKIKEVILPDTITSIGSMCFSYCTELTNVILPESLTVLENGIFNHCTKLGYIEIPNSVKKIEKDAFYRCDDLWAITLPDGVTSIGENAFAACPNLTAATIPESVVSIEDNAFEKSDSLRIYAKPDSAAETFSRANQISFEKLITVSVNGIDIVFDQPPITDTVNSRTLVPIRAVVDALNATTTWDAETKSVKITLPRHELLLRLGETVMTVDGEPYPLYSPAISFNGRTMVPIRNIIESINGSLAWDSEKKHIFIAAPLM